MYHRCGAGPIDASRRHTIGCDDAEMGESAYHDRQRKKRDQTEYQA